MTLWPHAYTWPWSGRLHGHRRIASLAGSEPGELLELLDPPPLDAEAARLNAKRSSITGEIELQPSVAVPGAAGGNGSAPPSGPPSALTLPTVPLDKAPGPGSGDMELDSPQPLPLSAPRLADAGPGALAMELGTPRHPDSGFAGEAGPGPSAWVAAFVNMEEGAYSDDLPGHAAPMGHEARRWVPEVRGGVVSRQGR
jgi:hypothetical protein